LVQCIHLNGLTYGVNQVKIFLAIC